MEKGVLELCWAAPIKTRKIERSGFFSYWTTTDKLEFTDWSEHAVNVFDSPIPQECQPMRGEQNQNELERRRRTAVSKDVNNGLSHSDLLDYEHLSSQP